MFSCVSPVESEKRAGIVKRGFTVFCWDGRLDTGMLDSLPLEYARCVQVYNYVPASVNIFNGLEGFCFVNFDWLVAFSGMGCKICLVLLAIPCLGSCGTVSAGPIREGSWVQEPPEVSLCLLGQLNPSFTSSSTKQNKKKLVSVPNRTKGTYTCPLGLLLTSWLSLL